MRVSPSAVEYIRRVHPRDDLRLLPPCATTGIGSLPFPVAETAVDLSLREDVPYLPQLPRLGGPSELMIPAALCDLGQVSVGQDGHCTLLWEPRGKRPSPELEVPGVAGAAFLQRLQETKPKVAKAQLAGPATVLACTRTEAGAPLADYPELAGRVVEHLAAKAGAIARALRQANVRPMLFLDEPGLGEGELPVGALELVRRAAHDAGALVGVHCCGQTRWPELLALDFDLLSLDVRLSLDALLEDRRAWSRFLERGATLSLGIIPTSPGARYDVGELCDSVEASLRATTPDFNQALSRMLLTPACGLALHSEEEALRIVGEVRQAQARLRALLK